MPAIRLPLLTAVFSALGSACTSYHAAYSWTPFAREIAGPVRSFHVWYPTDWPEKSYSYTPAIKGTVLVDGPLPEGEETKTYPVVMMSHGWESTGLSLSYIGEALARQGIVAAIVDHAIDAEREGADRGQALRARLVDLFKLRDHLREKEEKYHADLSRLGLLGFSEGAFTVLLAIGVHIESDPLLVGQDPKQRAFAEAMRGFVWPEKRLFPARAATLIAPFAGGMIRPIGEPLAVFVISGRGDLDSPIATNATPLVERLRGASWPVQSEEVSHAEHTSFLSDVGQASVQTSVASSVASFFKDRL